MVVAGGGAGGDKELFIVIRTVLDDAGIKRLRSQVMTLDKAQKKFGRVVEEGGRAQKQFNDAAIKTPMFLLGTMFVLREFSAKIGNFIQLSDAFADQQDAMADIADSIVTPAMDDYVDVLDDVADAVAKLPLEERKAAGQSLMLAKLYADLGAQAAELTIAMGGLASVAGVGAPAAMAAIAGTITAVTVPQLIVFGQAMGRGEDSSLDFAAAGENVVGMLSDVKPALIAPSDALTDFGLGVNSIIDTIRDIGPVSDEFLRMGEKIKTAKTPADQLLATLEGISRISVSGFKFTFGGGLLDAIGGAVKGVGEFLGKIFKFQAGGVVTRPTLGLIGEAGPEAVVPLSQAGLVGGGAGGGSYNVSFNITANVSNDIDLRNLATRLGEMWRQEIGIVRRGLV